MRTKRKTRPAIWREAFPEQAKALRPENTKAGGVKARSGSEARRMEVYKGIRYLFLLTTSYCEAGLCIGSKSKCTGIATDVHHRKGREGLLLFDTKWFFAVCLNCHRYIHEHPKDARELGFIVSRA